MTLTVRNPSRQERSANLVRLSAHVGEQELWFDLPADRAGELRGEPFVACLIGPAMSRGETLQLDDSLPICPDFLEGVHRVMQVVRHWPEALGAQMRPVAIRAMIDSPPPTSGVGTFFSGGIDGLYTLVEEQPRIDMAIFTHGIDFQLESPLANVAVGSNRTWLESRGVPLIEMASNARFIGRELGTKWNSHNGSCLAGYGHALGLSEVLIASGSSWVDWIGAGTHILTDPEFSSATTTVTHHGFGRLRWEKLARAAEEEGVADLLRVCWQDKGYNCGDCEKCRRTMLDLHLLGIHSSSFPPTARFADVAPRRVESFEDTCFLRQSLVLADRTGHVEAARAIRRRLAAWDRRSLLNSAEKIFFGGRLRRLRRLRRG